MRGGFVFYRQVRFALFAFLIFAAACRKQLSTTTLRLEARQEAGHQWLEVMEPDGARAANVWIGGCRNAAAESRVDVIYQSPRIFSLACRQQASLALASFRVSDGQRLLLESTIQKDKVQAFRSAVDKALRKSGLENAGDPASFALTAAGLVFPAGTAQVVVPATEMRPLLNPDAALLVGR